MFSQLITVRRLLSGHAFKPAKVQRQYVWDVQQCEMFHRDLEDAFNKSRDADYYLGPMIFTEDDEQELVWVYDGQQRLTTLTLYLAAMGQVCGGLEAAKVQGLSRVERNGELRPRIDLRTKGGALTKVVRNVRQFRAIPDNMPVDWRIYKIEKMFIQRLGALPNIADFARWVQSHVILNILWAEAESGLVLFDRANNRGVHLEWHELVKGVLSDAVGPDFKVRQGKSLDEFWYEAERGAKREFSDLIGSAAFIRYGTLDPSQALASIEDEFDTAQDETALDSAAHDFFDRLGAYAQTSRRLQTLRDTRGGVDGYSDLIRLQLLFLEYPHWKSLLMYAEDQGLSGERELAFLVRLRRLAYVAHLLGWFVWPTRLTGAFRRGIELLQGGFAQGRGIVTDLIEFSPEQLAQARGTLSSSMADKAYYRPLVKLWEAERAHEKGVLNASDVFLAHVEHILPRAPRGGWCRLFPDEEERADLRNWIGNLCLLSEDDNGRALNFEWRKKRDIYMNVRETFIGAREAATHVEWNAEVVGSRTKEMASGIVKILGL